MNADVYTFVWVFAASYFLGSVPFGFLVAKAAGVKNIMEHGSGNIGATNVLRVAGLRYAVPVLLLDVLKGALPGYLGLRFLGMGSLGAVIAGLFAIAGHNWSLFLSFRGGKGVATTAGVMTIAIPKLLLFALLVFFLTVLTTRVVSLGSLLAGWVTLGFSLSPGFTTWERVFVLVFTLLITYSHRANIRRLLSGTESRLGDRTRKRPGSGEGGRLER